MDFSKIIILALISEAIWETTKLIWQQGKLNTDRIGAIVIGIIIAFLTGIDIFGVVGLNVSVPLVGKLMTGLLISRGANFMHDIIGSINSVFVKGKNN